MQRDPFCLRLWISGVAVSAITSCTGSVSKLGADVRDGDGAQHESADGLQQAEGDGDDGASHPGDPSAGDEGDDSDTSPSDSGDALPSGDEDVGQVTDCVGEDALAHPEPVIHVSTSGTDSNSCGASGSACRTIKGGLRRITAGGTVAVHAGTYNESWISIPNDTVLWSADGNWSAKINSGSSSAVRFEGVRKAALEGFEVYATWNAGSAGDGLVRVMDQGASAAQEIVIKNCMLHDAPNDCDVIKVSGRVHGLLMTGLVVFNPARRTTGYFQENIDIFGRDVGNVAPNDPAISDVILRRSWLFHTSQGGDWLVYAKSEKPMQNIIYEDNIFGPSGGGGYGNPTVGIGTNDVANPGGYSVTHAIVRNNIFTGLHGDAALAIDNSSDVWVYGNTFVENSVGAGMIEFYSGTNGGSASDGIHVHDNIFAWNHPTTFYRVRTSGGLTSFSHSHNLYLETTLDSYTTDEAHSIYNDNPALSAPAVPSVNPLPTSIGRIMDEIAHFAPGSSSPVDAVGLVMSTEAGHPTFSRAKEKCDALAHARPDGAWTIGAIEVP